MRLLRWIAGFILAVIITIFAVANRQPVDIIWSPLHEPLHWPLYLVVLSGMGFGFLLGGLMVWLGDFPLRRSARHQRRTIRNLEKELKVAEKRGEAEPPASPPRPGLFKPSSAGEHRQV